MHGYTVLREKVKVNSRLTRRETNTRVQQEVRVTYCSQKYIVTKGLLDGIEEVYNLPTQEIYFVKESFENE